jgi:ATP-binding cassette, subfamily B, bacterial
MLNREKFTQAFSTPRLFLRAIALTWQSHRPMALLTMALLLFSALMAPLQVWITKLVIDGITSALKQGVTSATANWKSLLLSMALFLGVWVLGQITETLDGQVRELMGMQVNNHLQRMIFRKAAQLDIAFYETPAFHDQFTLTKNEAYRIQNVFYQFAGIIQNTITAIALFTLLAQISIWMPAILLLTALPRLLGIGYFTRKKADLYMKSIPEQRLTWYLSWLMGERDPAKEIRLFQMHDYLIERMHQANEKFVSKITKVVITQEKFSLLLTLIMVTGTAVIWGYTGWQALAGAISLGSVALVFQAVEQSRNNLLSFGYIGGFFAENSVYLQTLFKFLDLSPDAVAGALVRSPESTGVQADLSGLIEFQHVSFRYPGCEQAVLNDISFTIQPGETIALVGENGAGKTTLVKLLTRLYDPSEGVVTVSGRNLREVDPQRYYQQIGVIFQDFWQYDLTVKENIGFGNLPDMENMARIRQAAEMGGAAEMIEKMPHKYETMLGRVFYEDSKDLSGGEWQKIALARAFMRDVPLLILDEPTASLDAFAENAVYNRFAELTNGRTTIFVTHRLSSVRMAKKILVLKQGRLIEVGNHDELMAQGGEYASMFKLQAERYQPTNY